MGAYWRFGRRPVGLPSTQVEAGGMQRALDLAVLDPAIGQRGLLVGTGVVDRVDGVNELALDPEHSDGYVGHDPDRLTARDVRQGTHRDHRNLCFVIDNRMWYVKQACPRRVTGVNGSNVIVASQCLELRYEQHAF